MNVILVCLNNFQEHILTNIHHLLRLGEKRIHLIIQPHLKKHFASLQSKINIILTDELPDTFHYEGQSQMNQLFRNGFWVVTSLRFFYLYAAMKKYNLDQVLHLENDVLTYYPSAVLKNRVDSKKLMLTFGCFTRCVAGIVSIPNFEVLGKVLEDYNYKKNDMKNFSELQKKHPDLIDTLPTFINRKGKGPEEDFVTRNYERFGYLFDAAAIGQYLGGVDPRNLSTPLSRLFLFGQQLLHPRTVINNTIKIFSGNTVGYRNERSVIRYHYPIRMESEGGMQKPFLYYQNKRLPIFNLHIHSKKLEEFV